jgi:RNA polymerase sigma-70 factor, ECF subfamily
MPSAPALPSLPQPEEVPETPVLDPKAMRPGDLAALADEALMALVQQDEEAAYRHLVERHVQRMHRLAVRILSDSAQAEDAVQDAFLQVWIKRADWRNDGARFSTWLYRIVFNRCLDVKRRRREGPLNDEEDLPDESADAVETIYQGQIAERLRSAMAELPEPQYMALMMYYHEGYNAREVAEIMEVTTNAVESLLKRGRKNLRLYLKRLKVDAQQAFNDS